MNAPTAIESIIGVDVGSTFTHACLIDRVEGVYRLVASVEVPTTLGGPQNDLSLGVQQALAELERIIQRPLLDDAQEIILPERPSGEGVDAFFATCSAAPPLRCALIGLTDDLSLQSARRACAAAYTAILDEVALSGIPRTKRHRALAELLKMPLDILLMVGGTDSGPTALLESAARFLAALYAGVPQAKRPVLLFAGNQEARRPIAESVRGVLDYRVVENVRPALHTEHLAELDQELSLLYQERKLYTLPGYDRLARWCTAPIMATHEALSGVLQFLSAQRQLPQGILCLDVGGNNTLLLANRQGGLHRAVGARLGTAQGSRRLVELGGVAEIRQWLPTALGTEEIYAYLENASLRPHGIPQTEEDLYLTHAVVRRAVHLHMEALRRGEMNSEATAPLAFDVIAGRGGALAHTPQEGLIALTLLDAAQSAGLARLVLDWASLWPQLGAMARVAPLAATQVLERDAFCELGVVLAPLGRVPDGAPALEITLHYEDGRTLEAAVPAGTIVRFPLGSSERATLEVRPHRDLDIGLGRPGQGGRTEIVGGRLGLIVDARGRPLHLPEDAETRRQKIVSWMRSLCE